VPIIVAEVADLDEDSKMKISDSVIQGGITHIANKFDADIRVTCESCSASGTFTIFVCDSITCINKYCEHCKNSAYPKNCPTCIQEILLEDRRVKAAAEERARREGSLLAAERERNRILGRKKAAEEEAERERHRILVFKKAAEEEVERERVRLEKYSTIPAAIFRHRIFLIPLFQVICWWYLYNVAVIFPTDKGILPEAGLLILSLSLTIFIAYISVVSGGSRLLDYSAMAESGDAPERAIIFLLSPVISMGLCLIAIGVFGIDILIWISVGVILITIFTLVALFNSD